MRTVLPLLLAASLASVVLAGCLGDRRREPSPPEGLFPARPMVRVLRAQAAANDDTLFLRLRFEAATGNRHDYFVFRDGAWRHGGGGFRDVALDGGTQASGEVVLSVLLADPESPRTLRDFDKMGCFGLCHERQSHMPNWRPEDGHVPMAVWGGFGSFGDLWTWRAHRSGLAGFADDLSLGPDGMIPDAGQAPSSGLALGTNGLPPFVFADAGGAFAVPLDELLTGSFFAFDDGSLALPDALAVTTALALGWVAAEEDAVPAQLLSQPGGSRADVAAVSAHDGTGWDLLLARRLDTGDAAGDVPLASGRAYHLSFSLHTDGAAGRDHHVSFPLSLVIGSGGDASLAAARVPGAGDAAPPDFDDVVAFPVTELPLVLPGVTSFDWLVGAIADRDGAVRPADRIHGGAALFASGERGCTECHAMRATDAPPSWRDYGALERLVLRRGGVFGPTPTFQTETP